MATHKKKPRFRIVKIPALVLTMSIVMSFVVASLAGPASADDQPTGEETSQVTDTPAPKDDSSSEVPPADPEPEVVQKQEPVKAETPDPEPKEESQAPPKDEEKVNKPDPKPETSEGEDQVCDPLDSGKIDTTGDPEFVAVPNADAPLPAGMQISGYCVKAGSVNSGDGPHKVVFESPVDSWTITHPSGKAVSHYSLSYVAKPKCVESIDTKDIVAKYTTDQYNASVEYKGEELCKGVSKTVSLNSYATDGPTWETSGNQVFLGHDQFTVDADHTSGTLTVPAANCFYQTDLYWGSTRYDGVDGALPHYPDSPTPAGLIDHRNGGQACENPPEKINIPEQPTFEDLCGPDNANWNVPEDTDTLDWEKDDEGNLTVTIIKDGIEFTDGTTTHDFGIAPDSGEECPVEVEEPVIVEFCGYVKFVNPSEDNPKFRFTYSDSTQGGANSESVDVAGGDESHLIAINYKSIRVVVENVGGSEYFKEYPNLTIPQGCDVVVTAKCGEFTAKNLSSDVPAYLFYLEGNEEHQATLEPAGQPGASLTVKTAQGSIDWFAYFDEHNTKEGSVKVEQKCDTPPPVDKPRPPSGIGTPTSLDRPLPDTGGSNLGLLAIGGVLAAAGALVLSRRKSIA